MKEPFWNEDALDDVDMGFPSGKMLDQPGQVQQ